MELSSIKVHLYRSIFLLSVSTLISCCELVKPPLSSVFSVLFEGLPASTECRVALPFLPHFCIRVQVPDVRVCQCCLSSCAREAYVCSVQMLFGAQAMIARQTRIHACVCLCVCVCVCTCERVCVCLCVCISTSKLKMSTCGVYSFKLPHPSFRGGGGVSSLRCCLALSIQGAEQKATTYPYPCH